MSYGSGFAKITVLGVFTIWFQFSDIYIAQRFLLYWDISVYPHVISNTWKIYNMHHLRHEMGQELFCKLFAHEPIRHLAVMCETAWIVEWDQQWGFIKWWAEANIGKYWLRVKTWKIHCKIANFVALQATLKDITSPGNIGFCRRDNVASLQWLL